METYLVGGAIRNKLLGLPVKERDWVVVGSTPQTMLDAGYKQVGKQFPVFLHPKTKEEYALARTEQKIGKGYKGFKFDFTPDVTLEDDLKRRDLTINAIAENKKGDLVDPYGGKTDIDARVLRHVSPAFVEDPVRLLRVARFMAQFAALGFTIAPETLALMQEMVDNNEVSALVPERVWQEFDKALGSEHPEQFFYVLRQCGALAVLFPEIANLFETSLHNPQHQCDTVGDLTLFLLKNTVSGMTKEQRFAVIAYGFSLNSSLEVSQQLTQFNQRYRLPRAYKEMAELLGCHYATYRHLEKTKLENAFDFFYKTDAFRRSTRFKHFIELAHRIASLSDDSSLSANVKTWVFQAIEAAQSVDVGEIVDNNRNNRVALAKAIRVAQIEAAKEAVGK